MKVTFTPLQTPTVRPADMPEGVAFVYLLRGIKHIGIRRAGLLHQVKDDGSASVHAIEVMAEGVGPVLSRLDGQPLPDQEPVPLDRLKPWPVWYPDPQVEVRYWQMLGDGTFCLSDEGKYSRSLTSYIPMVLPTPYKAEVQDESE